jgi:hypothetical protein
MSRQGRAILNIAEVFAAAGAFLLGSTFGVLGAFVAGMGYIWAWLAVEEWADSQGVPW